MNNKIEVSTTILLKNSISVIESQRLIPLLDKIANKIKKEILVTDVQHQVVTMPFSDGQSGNIPIAALNLPNMFTIVLSTKSISMQIFLEQRLNAPKNLAKTIAFEVSSIFDKNLIANFESIQSGSITIAIQEDLGDINDFKAFLGKTSFADQAEKITEMGFEFIRFDNTNIKGASSQSTGYVSYALPERSGINTIISYLLGGISIKENGPINIDQKTIEDFIKSFTDTTTMVAELGKAYGAAKQ